MTKKDVGTAAYLVADESDTGPPYPLTASLEEDLRQASWRTEHHVMAGGDGDHFVDTPERVDTAARELCNPLRPTSSVGIGADSVYSLGANRRTSFIMALLKAYRAAARGTLNGQPPCVAYRAKIAGGPTKVYRRSPLPSGARTR